MNYRSFFILLLLAGYSIHASAQLRLIDSLSVNDSMVFIANYEKKGIDKRFYAQISRIPGQVSTVYRGDKTPITYPATTELLYIDQHTAITFEYKGNFTEANRPDNYIYKCVPTENGTLKKVDSIPINPIHLAYNFLDFYITNTPYIITFPVAVEGGTCIEEYDVYNLDLKKIGTVKPDLATCGVENKVVFSDDELNFISQDALHGNMISWTATDKNIQMKHQVRVIIDSLFTPSRYFVLDQQLYVTCRKKRTMEQKILRVTFIYDTSGKLVNQIESEYFFYGNMCKTTTGYLGIDTTRKEVSILDNYYRQISKMPLHGRNSIIDNYLLSASLTKLFIYEIN